MGAGKSRCGRLLSRRLGIAYFDSDREVEKKEHLTISEIFARKGERYFRSAERQALEKLFRRGEFIVATGGGAVVRAGSRRLLRKNGFVIWVKASRRVIERRTAGRGRPLLDAGGRRARIAALLRRREGRYRECAQAVLRNDDGPLGPKLERLLERHRLG